ncbi:MAG: hypothetical protein MZW92_56335 [Comamonadaceae bacterium]|nr:hypothetical protein [Comamonadaceae bacterium]
MGKIYEERGTSHGAVNVDKISAAEGFYDAALQAYTFDYKLEEKDKMDEKDSVTLGPKVH